ncbi:MAG: stage II sporulation protein M [Deltaproteobacteria bacterium]
MTTASDYRQHLEVETPEHVVLDLEIAGVGSRLLAAVVDTAILTGVATAAAILVAVLSSYGILPRGGAGGAWVAALLVGAGFALWNGYFMLFEGLRGGQTPGKRFAGIRVVRDTGHPVTMSAAVIRNLLRIADALPPPYLVGLALVAFHPRAKRLGDLAAGTVVVRDRPSPAMPGSGAGAGAALEPAAAAPLDDERFRLLSRFANRTDLPPEARDRIAAALAGRFADRARPPGASLAEFLLDLHARELARRRGRLAGRDGLGERLSARQGERWDAFQALAERATAAGLDSFAPDELPEFAARYREIAADLARARTYRADPGAVARLERLVAAGHNVLYREEQQTWRRVWAAVSREFPAAVVEARWQVLLAWALFTVPALGGYALMRERPALASALLPEVMLRRAEAGRQRAAEGRKYVSVDWSGRPLAASFIITNNIRVAIACFAGGIFLGVGSLVLLAYNGLAMGTFAGHFANQGLLGYLLEFIVGHGVLELFAIWVSGAAGFLLGKSLVAPGDRSRTDALVASGRTAVRMMGAVAVLLVIAGSIEGFLSVGGEGLAARAAVSAASLAFLAGYLARGARWRRASHLAQQGAHADRQLLDLP